MQEIFSYRKNFLLPSEKANFHLSLNRHGVYNKDMRKLFMVILFLFFLPFWATAQSVTSFSASPTSVRSGGQVDFYWTLQGAGGYSFFIPCQAGVKLKKQDGNVFACDSRFSSTIVTNDLLRISIFNVSGGTKSVTARLIPKDASGADVDSAASNLSVSVTTTSDPITNFVASATTTVSGEPVTVSWTTQHIDGVNLSLECSNEVKVTSPSYTPGGFLPCATAIFSNDLSSSGSVILNLFNSSSLRLPHKLTLLPAISSQSYDSTHAITITLEVASDLLPDPVINSFIASSTAIDSGKNLQLLWSADKAKAINLRMSCADSISATSTYNNNASLIQCGSSYFLSGVATSGVATLILENKDNFNREVIFTLVPSKKIGEYDEVRARSLVITVRPLAVQTITPARVISPPSPPAPQPILPPPSPAIAKKAVFTLFLGRGSRGVQVSALQGFFKKDPTLYPEGLVSGYFGPATERAVQRFQKKYGIAASGTPQTTGYGAVGPRTRARLNGLQ